MKTLRVPLFLLVVLAGSMVQAQEAAVPAGPPPANAPLRTPQEIEQLVGPIALYPDALIALILPAATAPADIVLAARHVRDFPSDRSQVEHRAWDESVKSLTNYPEVLRWIDENLHWTKQLGEAFADQPAEVMQAIQRLRAQARAAGTLVDTPQQTILAEPEVIRIVPTQPDVIYVPRYEPEVVFVDRPVYYSRPFMTFGIGVAVGSWLAFDCDWHRHSIWVGDRHRRWTGHDWHRPLVPMGPSPAYVHSMPVRQWRPAPRPAHVTVAVNWTRHTEIARPSPVGVTSTRSYAPRPSSGFVDGRRDAATGQPVPGARPRLVPSARSSAAANAPTPSIDMPANTLSNGAMTSPAPAAAPTPAPAQVRQGGNGNTWSRDRESRESRPRNTPSSNGTALAAGAPVTVQNPSPVAPAPQRSYSRGNNGQSLSGGGPVSVQNPSPAAPAVQQQRTYSRGSSAPSVAAPQARTQVSAPPAATPAPAAQAAPAAQPAPARNDAGDDRRSRREQHER